MFWVFGTHPGKNRREQLILTHSLIKSLGQAAECWQTANPLVESWYLRHQSQAPNRSEAEHDQNTLSRGSDGMIQGDRATLRHDRYISTIPRREASAIA